MDAISQKINTLEEAKELLQEHCCTVFEKMVIERICVRVIRQLCIENNHTHLTYQQKHTKFRTWQMTKVRFDQTADRTRGGWKAETQEQRPSPPPNPPKTK